MEDASSSPSPPPPVRLGMLHTHLFIALSAISFILLLLNTPPPPLLARLRPTELAPLLQCDFLLRFLPPGFFSLIPFLTLIVLCFLVAVNSP